MREWEMIPSQLEPHILDGDKVKRVTFYSTNEAGKKVNLILSWVISPIQIGRRDDDLSLHHLSKDMWDESIDITKVKAYRN